MNKLHSVKHTLESNVVMPESIYQFLMIYWVSLCRMSLSWCSCCVIKLIIAMLYGNMPSVVMLSVIILSVVLCIVLC